MQDNKNRKGQKVLTKGTQLHTAQKRYIVTDGVLSQTQASTVRQYLGVVDGANKLADIVLSTDMLERALKVVGVTTDLAVSSDTADIKLALSYSKDGYGKYAVILKVLKDL